MARLSLCFSDIPKEGWNLDCAISPDQLDLSSDEGHVVGQFQFIADVSQTGKGAYVKGTLIGRIGRECIRCLQEYMDDMTVQCTGSFHRPPDSEGRSRLSHPRDEDGDSLEEYNEETYACEGNQFDLADMLREHLILATPIQPLCQPDCLGLCQHCGQNLNLKYCECREKGTEVGKFAQLQRVVKDFRRTSLT